MTNDNNHELNSSFFKNKHTRKFLLIILGLVILIFLFSIIFNEGDINIVILSNYYFVVGIILLMISVICRVAAWSLHKKSVLKPYENNEKDMELAKTKIKLFIKITQFIGFVCILISVIFILIVLLEIYNEIGK